MGQQVRKMEHIKNILAKLITGKGISEQDIKGLVLGKNSGVIEKITKHLDQTANVAIAIKNNPKLLKEVIKNKAISEMFKYGRNKGK
ncbi:hypothetical protein LCGC14_1256720 [marine sediment metagenome]|uniref:Uncharacterized protein n=1 Tax=marine sediment metagenome TaxID=412755 RepID=A0A0F9NII6_9ZZZZ